MNKENGVIVLILMALLLSLPLPVFLMVFQPDFTDLTLLERLALSDASLVSARKWLTMVYFVGSTTLVVLVATIPSSPSPHLVRVGAALFLMGQVIDVVWRSLQFFYFHGVLGRTYLDGPARASAEVVAYAEQFDGLTTAFVAAFALLFAMGRICLGVAFVRKDVGILTGTAALLLVLNGAGNLGIFLNVATGGDLQLSLGAAYLPVWALGLVSLAVLGAGNNAVGWRG